MIYSDGVHLISDLSIEDLHSYCSKIGIKRCWFHSSSKFPHYDIPKKMRHSFFKSFPEVTNISSKEIIKIINSKNKLI